MAVSARVAPSASRPSRRRAWSRDRVRANLRAFVIYLRSVQGIPLARLSHVLRDLFGLDISEGALVNILDASREPFAMQTSLIKARLLAGTALASDETGMRVARAIGGSGVPSRDSAVFIAAKHRSKAVVHAFLGDWRPDYWISDRYGGQMGWATREHQVCLAHLIRDVNTRSTLATRCSRPA